MSKSEDKHHPGKGCKCGAWSAIECGCDGVDWRSSREVELEAIVDKLPTLDEFTGVTGVFFEGYDYCPACGGPASLDDHAENCVIGKLAAALAAKDKP